MPWRPLPKWKSWPTTTPDAPSSCPSRRSTKAAAEVPARPASKRRTKAPSSPSLRKTASFAGSGVRRNRGFSGAKNLRGCGSKVSTAAGARRARASRDRDLDQRPMAAVDAVEIADRQDRAAQGRRHGARRRGRRRKRPPSRRAQELRACRRSRRPSGPRPCPKPLRGSRLATACGPAAEAAAACGLTASQRDCPSVRRLDAGRLRTVGSPLAAGGARVR